MRNTFFTRQRLRPTRGASGQKNFDEFDATELYCPTCGRSMPVRKRLLLVLPEGDKFEYLCGACSTSVGTKIVKENKPPHLVTY